MSPVTMRQTPLPPDAEIRLVIPVDFHSGRSGGLWLKVLLGGLVVFTLALAAVVWRQLLQQIP